MKSIGEARQEIGGIPQPRYICARCYEHNLMIALQERDGRLICPVCKVESVSPDQRSN